MGFFHFLILQFILHGFALLMLERIGITFVKLPLIESACTPKIQTLLNFEHIWSDPKGERRRLMSSLTFPVAVKSG